MNDAIVNICVRFVERLGIGSSRREWCDDALGPGEAKRSLDGTRVVIQVHGIIELRGEIVGARWLCLFARTALGRARGVDKVVIVVATLDIDGRGRTRG